MKAIKFFAIAILFSGVSVMSSAQNTATSESVNAAANIISPLAITNTGSLNFGTLVSMASSYTATVGTDANRILSNENAAKVGGITSTVAVPTFNVTGDSNAKFAITLPVSTSLTTNTAGATAMTVDNFGHSAGASPQLSSGAASFKVGARLNVGEAQKAGSYTGTFTVTVAYE